MAKPFAFPLMPVRLVATFLLALASLKADPPDQAWQMRFDGNDAVVMPVDAVKSLGSAFTVQIWVYPEQRGFMTIAKRYLDDPDTDPNVSFQLNLFADGRVGWGESPGTPGSQKSFGSANPLPLKQWSHIAVTNDGSIMRGYINGVQFAQGPSPGAPAVSNQPISLGAQVRPANVTNPGFNFSSFVGMLRQFGVWNRALSAAEVQSAMTTSFKGTENGLVGFWPLDDGPGYTFHDITGAGKTASLLYPTRVKLVNGNPNLPVNDQYWPVWFQPSLSNASPFVWTEQIQGPTEIYAQSVTPIDFDNDGDLDLVTTEYWNPNLPLTTLKAYRNDGKGNFTEATNAVFGTAGIVTLGPARGFVADLNHDGRADLIIPEYGSDYFCCHPAPGGTHVLIQTSDGRLVDESATRAPVRDNANHDSDAADMDGDGNLDVFLADIKLVTDPPYLLMALLKNDGSGHLSVDNSRLPQSLARKSSFASRFIDANGDGFPDLFLGVGDSDTDLLLLNDGTGRFLDMIPGALPPKIGGSHGTTRRIAAGDLNGDGYPDLILPVQNDTLVGWQILISRHDGTFEDRTMDWLPDTIAQQSTLPATAIPFSGEMILKDLNGDGRPDLLVEWGKYSRLYMNNGQRLVDTSSFLPYTPGGQFAVGDFDGDGRTDVVYARTDNTGNAFGAGANAVLVVGLNKRDYTMPPPAPAPNPPGPWIGPVSIHNDGSGSAETLAPGMRIRIVGTNLGPVTQVRVTESSGVVLPSTLGGVTVTFDSTAARLVSVSATEIVAIVPFAVAGQWMTMVQVSYQGRVSQPVGMLVIDSNPMAYAKADPGKDYNFVFVAEAWKVNGTQRTKVTQSGQIAGGDRVAIRVTGAGQGQKKLTDDTVTQTQAFTPANSFSLYLGLAGGIGATPPTLTPVSMTYAPDGLAGVVEIVVDIPTAAAAGNFANATQFFVPELMIPAFATTRTLLWPFNGPATGCAYTFSSGGQTIVAQAFPASGGTGSITIATDAGCPWSVGSLPPGVTLTSAGSGTGSGTVSFQVAAGSGLKTFTVAGQIFTVDQAGSVSGMSALGSLAQVASQGSWVFTLDGVNLSPSPATARFSFSDNSGNPLLLPVTFPQSPFSMAVETAATIDRSLSPNAQVILQSTGPLKSTAMIGSGQLLANGSVSGFGIFSNPSLGWNAVVPLEARNAAKYYLAFDDTGSLVTGVAIANLSSTAAGVAVIIRDDTGAQIGTGTIQLVAQGHTSFLLNDPQLGFSVTNGKRGTVEFQTPSGGRISVLGLRANGPALTTLPVLASSDTPGGAIAHATYNGGFTSVFYLVNTGTASASFTLSFFDESGNALTVPLSLPQSGTTATTSALTRTLAPGAMLVVETVANDSAASVNGSTQMTTTGNVSGFEIFKWTTFGQEASVPLETRTPGSFVLVFDNTGGLTTGVALSNIAAASANVTAKIYDDAGNLLQTSSINLVGRGHTSFLLPSSYAATANKRGMVEFLVPSGGKITAVGLRAKADGTLTTIPVLTR